MIFRKLILIFFPPTKSTLSIFYVLARGFHQICNNLVQDSPHKMHLGEHPPDRQVHEINVKFVAAPKFRSDTNPNPNPTFPPFLKGVFPDEKMAKQKNIKP